MASRKPAGKSPSRLRDIPTGNDFGSDNDMLMVGAVAEETDIAPIRQQEALIFAQRWKGKRGQDGFKVCRALIEGDGSTPQPNEFLRPMYDARLRMAGDGFRLVLSNETREMIEKKAPWFASEAALLADEVMAEFVMMDNAAVFWQDAASRDDGSTIVSVLDTEIIKAYANGNYETLEVIPQKQDVPKDQRDKFEKKFLDAVSKGTAIVLDQEKGEYFNVATMTKRGRGLALPSMLGCLDALAQLEAIRTGDMAGAWDSRFLIKHWQLGHEIRNGDRAGRKDNFATPKKIAAMKAEMRRKRGFLYDLFSNFDVTLNYRYIPAEFFSEKKYEGSLMRLRRWGAALAAMSMKEAPDGVLALAQADIKAIRARVGLLLETVFNRPEYGLPKLKKGERVKVAWSPVTFLSPDKVAISVGQWLDRGMISVTTSRELIGVDPETETARLTAEKGQDGFRPNFVASIGVVEDQPAPGDGGKPAAKKKGTAGADNGGSASPANGRPAGS